MIKNLNYYDYEDYSYMVSLAAVCNGKRNIIIVDDAGELLAQMGLKIENNYLKLFDENSEELYADVELPTSIKDITSTAYTQDKKGIIITVENTDGSSSEIELDITDLIVVYKAGKGIDIDNQNTISVKVKNAEEGETQILSVDNDGIDIDLTSVYNTIDALEEKVDNIVVPTKVSDLENDSAYVTSEELEAFSSETFDSLSLKVDKETLDEEIENVYLGAESMVADAVSGLTDKIVEDVLVINKSILALTTAAGIENEDGEIYYNAHNDDIILSGASSLDNADMLLSEHLTELSSKVDSISETTFTKEEVEEILNLKIGVETFESISGDVETLKSNVETLSESNETISGDVDVLKSDVETLKDEKADLSEVEDNYYDIDEITELLEAKDEKLEEELVKKQDTLVSGENIKTINGESLLGSSDIVTQNLTAGDNISITNSVISVTGLSNFDPTNIETEISNAITDLNNKIALKANTIDVYTKADIDIQHNSLVSSINQKAEASNVYTKSETYSNTQADEKIAEGVANGIKDLITKESVEDKLTTLSGAVDTKVSETASSTLNSANVYTNSAISGVTSGVNSLGKKISVLANGEFGEQSYDPTSGNGLLDELYKLVHSLIDGMDEGNLTPIATSLKNIEDRLTALENKS